MAACVCASARAQVQEHRVRGEVWCGRLDATEGPSDAVPTRASGRGFDINFSLRALQAAVGQSVLAQAPPRGVGIHVVGGPEERLKRLRPRRHPPLARVVAPNRHSAICSRERAMPMRFATIKMTLEGARGPGAAA